MSRLIKEDLKDLESIMRVIIRAAGGFGKGVALGSDYAARAAHLWHDGQDERLRALVPEWTRQIRLALRGNGNRQQAADTPVRQQALPLEEAPLEEPPKIRIHKVSESSGASTVLPPPRMFECRANAEGLVIALSHQKALDQFLAHVHIYIKNAYVNIKEQEE